MITATRSGGVVCSSIARVKALSVHCISVVPSKLPTTIGPLSAAIRPQTRQKHVCHAGAMEIAGSVPQDDPTGTSTGKHHGEWNIALFILYFLFNYSVCALLTSFCFNKRRISNVAGSYACDAVLFNNFCFCSPAVCCHVGSLPVCFVIRSLPTTSRACCQYCMGQIDDVILLSREDYRT